MMKFELPRGQVVKIALYCAIVLAGSGIRPCDLEDRWDWLPRDRIGYRLLHGTKMKCDWCGEEYDEDRLYLTKCDLYLCGLCRDDHDRQGCPDCEWEQGFEAADYDRDKARDA